VCERIKERYNLISCGVCIRKRIQCGKMESGMKKLGTTLVKANPEVCEKLSGLSCLNVNKLSRSRINGTHQGDCNV